MRQLRAHYYISELLKSTFLTVSGDLELARMAHKTSQSSVQNRPHLLQSAYYISISAADFHVLDKITLKKHGMGISGKNYYFGQLHGSTGRNNHLQKPSSPAPTIPFQNPLPLISAAQSWPHSAEFVAPFEYLPKLWFLAEIPISLPF